MWVSWVAQTLLLALLSGISHAIGSIIMYNVHEEAYSFHIVLSKMRVYLYVGCVTGPASYYLLWGRFVDDFWVAALISCAAHFVVGLYLSYVRKEQMMETKKHED
jgi:hypothetical protein